MCPTSRHESRATWGPRRRPGVLVGVLLGHVALLLGWHHELLPRVQQAPPHTQRPELVWLNLAVLPLPVQPTVHANPPPPNAAAYRQTPPAPAKPAPVPTAAAGPSEAPRVAEPTPISTAIHLPEPAASAASAPRERLMDSAATRTAIRAAGRQALLSERAAGAIDQPMVSQAEKQTQAVSRSAKGDCLRGEFSGGGMGLLSIPFFVVAEANGHCGR